MTQKKVSIFMGGTGANTAAEARDALGVLATSGGTVTGVLNVSSTLITQNVEPVANITYDLGTSTKRFKDLWLSNSTIHLGEATISAQGGNVSFGNAEVQLSNVTTKLNVTNDLFVSGNVGIGTENPGSKLDIIGNIAFSGTMTSSSAAANGVAYFNSSKVLTSGSGLAFNGAQLGLTNPAGAAILKLDANTIPEIDFYISGSIKSYIYAPSTSLQFNTVGTNPILFMPNESERMRVDSNGNVGIGTTNPVAKLHVQGGNLTLGTPNSYAATGRWMSIEGNADSDGEGSSRIFFAENNSGLPDSFGLSIGYRGGNTSITSASGNVWNGLSQIENAEWAFFGHDNNSTGAIIFKGIRTAEWVNFPTANVSIGPRVTGKLQVGFSDSSTTTISEGITITNYQGGAGVFAGIRLSTYGDGSGGLYPKQFIGAVRHPSGAGKGDIIFCNRDASDTSVVSASDEKMRIKFDGGVGIGTTDPSNTKLWVRGDWVGGHSTIKVQGISDNTTGIGFYNTSSTRVGYVYTATNEFGVWSDLNAPMSFGTNGVLRLNISASGIISTPYQPAFFAYGIGGGTHPSGSTIIFPSTRVNRGSHYNTSNGRFTAPVTGVYFFTWSQIGGNSDTVWRYWIAINGSNVGDLHLRLDTSASGTEYGTNGNRNAILSLNAGDYVTIYFQSDSGADQYPGGDSVGNDYPNFGGYLLG